MKRSAPMKRTAFERRQKKAVAAGPTHKPCAHCGAAFLPVRPLQVVCGPMCARRKVEADKKAERARDKARGQALKTLYDHIREADRAFAAYIRERDRQAGHACISSGRALDWSGNKVDAGHYRSRGAASHLRYHEDNCHAQSKQENLWKAGNAVDYRMKLIARIGLQRVEALEADNRVHHWTASELESIKRCYVEKLKDLKRGQG